MKRHDFSGFNVTNQVFLSGTGNLRGRIGVRGEVNVLVRIATAEVTGRIQTELVDI